MPDGQDPFKEFGGQEIGGGDDPFAEFGGQTLKKKESGKPSSLGSLFGNALASAGPSTSKTKREDVVGDAEVINGAHVKYTEGVKPVQDPTIAHDDKDPVGNVLKPLRQRVSEIKQRQVSESTGQKTALPQTQKDPTPEKELQRLEDYADQNTFENGLHAQEYLQGVAAENNGQLPEGNETVALAKRKAENYNKLAQNINNYGSITMSAINDYKQQHPTFAKQLQAIAQNNFGSEQIPEALEGRIVADYLAEHGKDLEAYAAQNPDHAEDYEDLKTNILNRYPEFGKNVVSNEVARKVQELGKNGIFATWTGDKYIHKVNEVAQALYKNNPQKLQIFQAIPDEEKTKWAGGFVNAFASGVKDAFKGVGNTAHIFTGDKADTVFEGLKEEGEAVNNEAKGWAGLANEAGHMGGFVAGMAAGGAALRGAGLAPKVADKAMTIGTFLGDEIRRGQMKYPDNPAKATLAGGLNTLAFAVLSDLVPHGKINNVLKGVRRDIAEGLEKLSSENLSKEAVREVGANAITKALDYAGDFAKQHSKSIAEMVGLSAMNQGLDKLLGLGDDAYKQYHPEDELWETARAMAVGNFLPNLIAAKGAYDKRSFAKDALWELTTDAAARERILNNPDIPEEVKQSLQDKLTFSEYVLGNLAEQPDLTEAQKKKYLLQSVAERELHKKADELKEEPVLQTPIVEEIKQSQKVKEDILSGKDDGSDPEAPKVSVLMPDEVRKPEVTTIAPKENAAEEKRSPAIILPQSNKAPNVIANEPARPETTATEIQQEAAIENNGGIASDVQGSGDGIGKEEGTGIAAEEIKTEINEIPITPKEEIPTATEPNQEGEGAGNIPPAGAANTSAAENTPKGNKALANRLVGAKNITQEARDGIAREGLNYEPRSHKEAEDIAKAIVDEAGMDEAVLMARAQTFGGDINTLIQTEALNRLYNEEQKAKTPEEKLAIASKFAEIGIQLDKWAREKAGRGISALAYFYKKSPIGVAMIENAKRKESFDQWTKNKDQSWKEFFDEMMKEEAFASLVKEEVNKELGKSAIQAKSEKRRKDINDFFDKAKFNDDGALYSTIIPPKLINAAIEGMKQAALAGESVLTVVEKGIEIINKEVKDWDTEKFKKEWTQKLKPFTKEETKSRLDIYKDRLRDQIESLNKQIEKGERDRKEGDKLLLDEEAKALKEQRDSLKRTLDEIDPVEHTRTPLSETQKINLARKAIEKSIAEYERRISEGDTSAKKREGIKTPELEELRRQRDELREEYEVTKKHDARMEALEAELERIRKRKDREPKKEAQKREVSAEEKALLDKIEAAQEEWDNEIKAARQAKKDYQKIETERNRQLKRVAELQEKLAELQKGNLSKGNPKEKKVDTPEIEALKQEIAATEKSVRASLAHQKRLKDLNTELQRVKNRQQKEKKEKRTVTPEEQLIKDQIESEKKAWAIEENIARLEQELERVRSREEKQSEKKDKQELTDREKELTKQIEAEKKAWAKETEPKRKEAAKLKTIQARIADYERRIREKDVSRQEKTEDSEEVKQLKAELQKVKEEYQQLDEYQRIIQDKVLEKFRKKLKGLTDKEKEEVVSRSFKKIVENGGLEYDDFKKIIADVTGRGELTPDEVKRLKELVEKTNSVEAAAQKAMTERTPEALAAVRKAQQEAAEAGRELNELLYNRPNVLKRITGLMQLNTLGIVALINNPVYNIVNQIGLRFPVGVVNTIIEQGISAGARVLGKKYMPETNILQSQGEFFRKLGFGTKEALAQVATGLNRQDYIQKELYQQQIRPTKSRRELWAHFTGKKKLNKAQIIDKTLQAFPQGWVAEFVARMLNVGDKPQRFSAEGAQAAVFAKALGLKDMDYELFIEFPREEAYRAFKAKGLPDAEAAKKADYIRDTIVREGERSTFQQDNLLNDTLNKIFGGERSGVGGFAKAMIVSPFIKIPANAFWSGFNILNPEVAMLQSAYYGAKAYSTRNKGDNTSAKAAHEAKYWFAHAIVGMATRGVILALVAAGIYNPKNDEDDTKKEREGETNYEKQGGINVTKLWALITGQDPSKVEGGLIVDNRWWGHFGTVGNAIVKKEETMTEEQRKAQQDFWDAVWGGMELEGLREAEEGLFANTSSILTAINSGSGTFFERYALNSANMFMNIAQPAMFAQDSRASQNKLTTTKADSFLEQLNNSMLQRSSLYRKLSDQYPPSKVSIWGEEIKPTDGKWARMFGISQTNKDAFAYPLHEDYKKTKDIGFFPPAVMPTLNEKKLNAEQHRKLEMYVGQARKSYVAPYINDGATIEGFGQRYSEIKDPEVKKRVLHYLYDMGRRAGVEKFVQEFPEFQKPEKTASREEQDDAFKSFISSLKNEQ